MRRPRPKIINETGLRGDDLRKAVFVCLRKVDKDFSGEWEYPLKTLTFHQSNDFYSHGHFDLETSAVEIFIARGFNATKLWEVDELLQIITHELRHVAGLEHAEMAEGPHWWTVDVTWAPMDLRFRYRKGEEPHPYERKIRDYTEKLENLGDD